MSLDLIISNISDIDRLDYKYEYISVIKIDIKMMRNSK